MPFVRITMMPRDEAVKKAQAKEIADSIMNHCKVGPEHAWIVFEEPPKSSWAFGGKMASEK